MTDDPASTVRTMNRTVISLERTPPNGAAYGLCAWCGAAKGLQATITTVDGGATYETTVEQYCPGESNHDEKVPLRLAGSLA